MAKRKQFEIALGERDNLKSDDNPRVGDPIEITIPDYEDDEISIAGRTLVLNPPRLHRFLMLSAQWESAGDRLFDTMSLATQFVMETLSDEDARYVRRRFNDEDDPFGLEALSSIIETFTEEWSARPTERSSGSSSSRSRSGSGSTAKRLSQDETTSAD